MIASEPTVKLMLQHPLHSSLTVINSLIKIALQNR